MSMCKGSIPADDIGGSNRSLTHIAANTSSSRAHVNDPSGISPSYDEFLHVLLVPFLGRLGRSVVRQCSIGLIYKVVSIHTHDSIVIGLERLVVNPFDSRFPYAGHVLPYAAVWFFDDADSLPGIV